jgi:hypothetical protein
LPECRPGTLPSQAAFSGLRAFLGGKDFLFKNDADAMLFRARMPPPCSGCWLLCSIFWRRL